MTVLRDIKKDNDGRYESSKYKDINGEQQYIPHPDHASLVTKAGRPFDHLYDPLLPLQQWAWSKCPFSNVFDADDTDVKVPVLEESQDPTALSEHSALYAKATLYYHTAAVVLALENILPTESIALDPAKDQTSTGRGRLKRKAGMQHVDSSLNSAKDNEDAMSEPDIPSKKMAKRNTSSKKHRGVEEN